MKMLLVLGLNRVLETTGNRADETNVSPATSVHTHPGIYEGVRSSHKALDIHIAWMGGEGGRE
jgi:hypothetical protein